MSNRNKTGVTYLDKKVNVNESKRIVACNLTFGINITNIPCNEMLTNGEILSKLVTITGANIDTYLDDFGNEQVYFNWNTTGIARCSPEDKFSDDLGYKIALTKAQRTAFKTASTFYRTLFDLIGEKMGSLVKINNGAVASYKNCYSHIEELIDRYF